MKTKKISLETLKWISENVDQIFVSGVLSEELHKILDTEDKINEHIWKATEKEILDFLWKNKKIHVWRSPTAPETEFTVSLQLIKNQD